MKALTIDKICDKLDIAYLYAQVVFSWLIILFGVSYALMSICRGSDLFIVFCFAAIAFVGYKLMLRTSLKELREAKNNKSNER